MRTSGPVRASLVLLLVATFVGSASSQGVAVYGESLGSQWNATTSYPTAILNSGCVVDSGYVYCVAGRTAVGGSGIDLVYYARLSSSGVGQWASTTRYPTTMDVPSCSASLDYVYCIGGWNGSKITADVYYARLSSNGVSSWNSTAKYPFPVEDQSCTTDSDYIYCVGGFNGTSSTSASYYSRLLPSGGINGTWVPGGSYPAGIGYPDCVAASGYIYCIGGYNHGNTNEAYYAPFSSNGVGSWNQTTSYPGPTSGSSGEVCVVYSAYVYCSLHGGSSFYFSQLSSKGLGSWNSTTSYPMNDQFQSCVAYSSSLYCIGGNAANATSSVAPTNATFYVSIAPTPVPEFPDSIVATLFVANALAASLILVDRLRSRTVRRPQHEATIQPSWKIRKPAVRPNGTLIPWLYHRNR